MTTIPGFESSRFEPNAILRGAQLTVVGALRALQNPGLFTSQHYKQAAIAVAAGVGIRVLIAIPVIGIRVLLSFINLFADVSWDDSILEGLEFVEHSVLQVPFFFMSLMRYITPTLDNMFMESLQWVDSTYISKHKSEDPHQLRAMYYPTLKMYDTHVRIKQEKNPQQGVQLFAQRFARKAAISLGIYALSFVPYIGPFVLPAASFYTFNKSVGWQPAVVVFGVGLILPKRFLVMFLQSYFSSRSLMRELLEPYFSRIQYSKSEKKQWFRDRSGVLYGFALAFFIFLKIPLLGVLIYGLAEASTAYLITKITEPPPAPAEVDNFKKSDVKWVNKHEFLSLPVDALDKFNAKVKSEEHRLQEKLPQGRQFS